MAKSKKDSKKSFTIVNGEPVRNYFSFYRSFIDAIRVIPDDKEKWLAIDTIIRCALDGTEPNIEELPPMVKLFVVGFLYILKESYENWRNGVKGAPFGELGGNPNLTISKTEGATPLTTPTSTPQATPQATPNRIEINRIELNQKELNQIQPNPTSTSSVIVADDGGKSQNKDFFEEFFKTENDGYNEQLLKNLHAENQATTTMDDLRNLALCVIGEWEQSHVMHPDYPEWSNHLRNAIRVKNRKTSKGDGINPFDQRIKELSTPNPFDQYIKELQDKNPDSHDSNNPPF